MLEKITKIIKLLGNQKVLRMLVSMNSSGYLKEIGWINSFKNQMPMDINSSPLPWVTYGFIDFVSERLNKTMDVFEYGSGNSTLWYGKKVNYVTSVEHDISWFEKIKNKMPNNVNINYEELIYNGDYSKFPTKLDKKFDIVVIDGRDRVNCIKNSINCIKEDGVIVLDDSEREVYLNGMKFLLENNFKKIDFWGISPGLFYKKNTTIFYKSNNCLGI
ncbi:MAG: hypothetical protein AB7G20_07000 [Sulfurimonas sp.]|uniref:hypothetical protein n=1 Tax=Sulfurimonas sp. TaxID=2022749 RepID=UPI003D0E6584